jgi:hypothetical protein
MSGLERTEKVFLLALQVTTKAHFDVLQALVRRCEVTRISRRRQLGQMLVDGLVVLPQFASQSEVFGGLGPAAVMDLFCPRLAEGLLGRAGTLLRADTDENRTPVEILFVGGGDLVTPEAQSANYANQVARGAAHEGALQSGQERSGSEPSHRGNRYRPANRPKGGTKQCAGQHSGLGV